MECCVDGVLVGMCGLFKCLVLFEFDLGYVLFVEYEGCGYVLEVVCGCVIYVKVVLGWMMLMVIMVVDNLLSVVLLGKLGFVE